MERLLKILHFSEGSCILFVLKNMRRNEKKANPLNVPDTKRTLPPLWRQGIRQKTLQ